MIRDTRRRGYAILSMLIALVIIGVLTQSFFSVDVPGGKMWVVSQQDRTRAAVAQVNFRSAETEFFMHTEGRQLPIDELRRELQSLSRYSKDGRFFVDHQGQLRLTTMMDTKPFAQKFNFPRVR